MDVYVSSSGVWKKITSMFVSSGGVWKQVTAGFVSSSGVWKKFFSVILSAPINTVAPSVSPSSGVAGSTTFSTTNGTWNPGDADGVYEYQWQYNDQGSLWLSISGATSSTYSPPSNYVSIYGSSLRCRVTATNTVGSTSATSNQVTVTVPVPAGGSVSISPSGTQLAGTTLTVSTTGWSNSPTSYNVRLYASTSNPPSDGGVGSVLKASTSSSSLTYTITTSDATAPAYYFKAFATASNAGGTSAQVESNVVLSALPSAPSGGVVTLSPSGNQYDGTTLTASTFGWSGSPTSYSLRLYASTSNPPSPGGAGSVLKTSTTSTSLTYTITSSDAAPPAYYFKAFASATNTGGTSADAESNVVLSVLRTVPGTVNSLTATSSLSGTNLNWSASWSAPSDNGGASITGYRVYVERAGSSSGPWIASTTQIPAGSGAYTQSSPYFTSSTSVSGRVTGTSATWIRVWVAAVNSVGTGSYTSAVG